MRDRHAARRLRRRPPAGRPDHPDRPRLPARGSPRTRQSRSAWRNDRSRPTRLRRCRMKGKGRSCAGSVDVDGFDLDVVRTSRWTATYDVGSAVDRDVDLRSSSFARDDAGHQVDAVLVAGGACARWLAVLRRQGARSRVGSDVYVAVDAHGGVKVKVKVHVQEPVSRRSRDVNARCRGRPRADGVGRRDRDHRIGSGCPAHTSRRPRKRRW
jgi:hypothetical protein